MTYGPSLNSQFVNFLKVYRTPYLIRNKPINFVYASLRKLFIILTCQHAMRSFNDEVLNVSHYNRRCLGRDFRIIAQAKVFKTRNSK